MGIERQRVEGEGARGRGRWIAIGTGDLVVWFAATFGIAFAVVEWRSDSSKEPSFFCQEVFKGALEGRWDRDRAGSLLETFCLK